MKTSKHFGVILAILVGGTLFPASLPCFADQSASPPPPEERSGPRPPRRGAAPERSMGWIFDRMGKFFSAMPSEQQWTEAAQFVSAISPSRWQVVEQVLQSPERRDRVRQFIYSRYKELKQLSETNEEQYQAMLEQVKIEDEIFSLDTRLEQAQSPGERQDLQDELRGKVQNLVERELDDRERRLQRIQEKLNRERAALRQDRERMDEVVDQRVRGVRRSSDRFRAWAARDGKRDRRGPSSQPPPPRRPRSDRPPGDRRPASP